MDEYHFRELETERLRLIKIAPEHQEDIFHFASNRKNTKYMTWPRHKTRANTAKFIELSVELYEEECHYDWAIWYRNGGKVIGTIGLSNLNRQANGAEFGYILSREYWGQGLVPEACGVLLDFCFNTLNLDMMTACCDLANKSSERVMQKLAMTYGGIKPYQLIKKRKPVPYKWYVIKKSDLSFSKL